MLKNYLKGFACIVLLMGSILINTAIADASTEFADIYLYVGDTCDLNEFYAENDLEVLGCTSSSSIVSVINNTTIMGMDIGRTDIEVTYRYDTGTVGSQILSVKVKLPTGVYRLKKSGSSDYLSMSSLQMTSRVPLCYDTLQSTGDTALRQLWYLEESGNKYIIRPYVDSNMLLEMNFNEARVIESYKSYDSDYEEHWHRKLTITNFGYIHNQLYEDNPIGIYLNDATVIGSEEITKDTQKKWLFEHVSETPDGILICDNKEGIVSHSNLGTDSTRHISKGSTKSLVDLKIKVLPYGTDLTDLYFVWSSSNTDIATVNSSTGAVTGVSHGNVTITGTATINNTIYQVSYPVCVLKYSDGIVTLRNHGTNSTLFPYEYDTSTTYFKALFNETPQNVAEWYMRADLDGYYQFTLANASVENSYKNLKYYLGVNDEGNGLDVRLMYYDLNNLSHFKWKIEDNTYVSSSLAMIYPKSAAYNGRALMINGSNDLLELEYASDEDYEFCWNLSERTYLQKRLEWYIHPIYDESYLEYFDGDLAAMKSYINECVGYAASIISDSFDIYVDCSEPIAYTLPDNLNVLNVNAGETAPTDSAIIWSDIRNTFFSGKSELYKVQNTYILFSDYDMVTGQGESEYCGSWHAFDIIILNKMDNETTQRAPYATLHELSHAIGSQDHSHIDGACGYSHVCAVCAPMDARRPESCIMDEDDFDPENPYCDDCKYEIKLHLYNHHLVNIE